MKRLVLDASVALRWFLDDPVIAYALRVRELLAAGWRAMVPALWHLEMASSIALAEKRGVLTKSDADRVLVDIEQFTAQGLETDTAFVSTRQVLTTSRAFQLSIYDAVYLDLARRERLSLATLDERLRGAAQKAGVEVMR